MIPTPEHLSRRARVASGAVVASFTALALAGFALIVYGVALVSRPAAFITGGLIVGAAGFLGALGKPKPEGDRF